MKIIIIIHPHVILYCKKIIILMGKDCNAMVKTVWLMVSYFKFWQWTYSELTVNTLIN